MVLDWSPTEQEIKNEFPCSSGKGCNGPAESWLHWVEGPARISVEGDVLRFSTALGGDLFRRTGFFVKLYGETEIHIERSLMFPSDLKMIDWINIGASPMSFKLPGKSPFDSGGLSFIHRREGYLEYKIFYYKTEDYPEKRHQTPFSDSLHVPLGEWFELDTHYYIHETEGFCIHELDGEEIFNEHDMVTKWAGEQSGPYVPFRFYTPVDIPQSMFYADLAIYGEGVIHEPECKVDVDCGPDKICVNGKCVDKLEPSEKTIAAQMLPFPILLNKMWKMREKVFTDEMHRKLHPII